VILNKNSPRYRELLWIACRTDSGAVHCNLCSMEVIPGDDWDESHLGAPSALAGRTVGIAHRACNRRHGAEVVTPAVAKAKRQHRNHVGITGPGLSRNPLPGGRRSKYKKKMNGEVVLR
jgi:hypothetical protein